MKDIDEEITVVGLKNSGHRRMGPQEPPVSTTNSPKMIKCVQCTFEFQTQGLLDAHIKTHQISFECSDCSETFLQKIKLEEHIQKEHKADEWNCMDCSHQGSCISDLLKHLKLTGHQPSQAEGDKRKVFHDYKQCYTCKMDFDGYFNLMNHRKSMHPSSKKCRNFPDSCKFTDNCWYVHDETMKEETNLDNFKCDLCENEIKGRDNFMKHKKALHPVSVPTCDNFRKNQCQRDEKDCWFEHKLDVNQSDVFPSLPKSHYSEKMGFREVLGNTFPPDQLKTVLNMVGTLVKKMENMEKESDELIEEKLPKI